MPRQLLLMCLEKDEYTEERIESWMDRRQRLHRLEHERAVMRGGMRVHVSLAEPGVALGLLRVSVLTRDLVLVLDAAGDGGDEQNEQESGRPAKAAVAPRLGGVFDRDGQSRRPGDGRGDHCLVVVVEAEYWTSFAFSGSTPSPMLTTTRMPALRSPAAPLSLPRLNAVSGVISKVMSLPSVVFTRTLFLSMDAMVPISLWS